MDAVDYRKLLEQLIRIEGAKLAPYRDAAGNLIVAPDHYVKRIGVTGTGMAVVEVDIRAVAHELEASWPTLGDLDAIRKRVLIHMTFNMGIRGLLAMLRFASAVEFRLWDTAADEMLISHWRDVVPASPTVRSAFRRLPFPRGGIRLPRRAASLSAALGPPG